MANIDAALDVYEGSHWRELVEADRQALREKMSAALLASAKAHGDSAEVADQVARDDRRSI